MSKEAPDRVEIQPPYQGTFFLWGGEDRSLRTGDTVPSVGMATTYAVLLDAPEVAPDRFLWVQESKITNVMAHQPIVDKSVFDARGAFLGTGGTPLERPHLGQTSTATLVEMLAKELQPRMAALPHRFHVRPGFSTEILLPDDLTPREAERLASFIRVLPFPASKS